MEKYVSKWFSFCVLFLDFHKQSSRFWFFSICHIISTCCFSKGVISDQVHTNFSSEFYASLLHYSVLDFTFFLCMFLYLCFCHIMQCSCIKDIRQYSKLIGKQCLLNYLKQHWCLNLYHNLMKLLKIKITHNQLKWISA